MFNAHVYLKKIISSTLSYSLKIFGNDIVETTKDSLFKSNSNTNVEF